MNHDGFRIYLCRTPPQLKIADGCVTWITDKLVNPGQHRAPAKGLGLGGFHLAIPG
jgi:hypothetical protein